MDRKSRLKRRRILRAAEAAKPVSMKQFLEAVGKIATKEGQTYYRVHIALLHSGYHPEFEIEYTAYINGYKQVSAKTLPDVLKLMEDDIDAKKMGIVAGSLPSDVLVDL